MYDIRRASAGDAPAMSPSAQHGRRSLDAVFGLFLAGGVTVIGYVLWAVADWIHSQGEGAFGLYYLGACSFLPTFLAWVVGGVHLFMTPRDRNLRLAVTLTTAHLVRWLIVVSVALRDHPSWGWVMSS